MAKKGGGDVGQVLLVLGGVALLAYLIGGKGKNNSPLLPDFIDDPIDRVVAALNNMFGQHWVNLALTYVQAQMELAMPGAAALVNAVHWAERNYAGQPGAIKRRAARRKLKT